MFIFLFIEMSLEVAQMKDQKLMLELKSNRSVDASIRLEDYIEKHEGGLITTIRYNTDNTMDNRMTITRKQ